VVSDELSLAVSEASRVRAARWRQLAARLSPVYAGPVSLAFFVYAADVASSRSAQQLFSLGANNG